MLDLAGEIGTPVWNELVTPDVATATQFYSDVLGVGWESMSIEDREYACLVVDGRQVGGAMPPPSDGMPPHWNVYFNVESSDDTATKATGLGGTVVAPAFDVPGAGRTVALTDPQGAMFNLLAD